MNIHQSSPLFVDFGFTSTSIGQCLASARLAVKTSVKYLQPTVNSDPWIPSSKLESCIFADGWTRAWVDKVQKKMQELNSEVKTTDVFFPSQSAGFLATGYHENLKEGIWSNSLKPHQVCCLTHSSYWLHWSCLHQFLPSLHWPKYESLAPGTKDQEHLHCQW